MQSIKVVFIGESKCGKTAVQHVLCGMGFPAAYVATVFDNTAANFAGNGATFNMSMWDTAGMEDYDRLRPLSYPGTNVFALCFDMSDAKSLQIAGEKFYKEAKHHLPEAPFFVLGCKSDLYNANSMLREQAQAMTQKLNAFSFIECSAQTGDGMSAIFPTAIQASKSANVLSFADAKLAALVDNIENSDANMKELVEYMLEKDLDLETTVKRINSEVMIQKLIANNAPMSLVQQVLLKADKVTAYMFEACAPHDELAPYLANKCDYDTDIFANITQMPFASFKAYVAALTPAYIAENKDRILECNRLLQELHKSKKLQFTDAELTEVLLQIMRNRENQGFQNVATLCTQLPVEVAFEGIIYPDILKLVMDKVDVHNIRNNKGQTLLMRACVTSNAEDAIRLLLETDKCDMTAIDNNGKSVMEYLQRDRDYHMLYQTYLATCQEKQANKALTKLHESVDELGATMCNVDAKLDAILQKLK